MILFSVVYLALVEMASSQTQGDFKHTPTYTNTLNLITEMMMITASIKKEHMLKCDEEAKKQPNFPKVPPANIKKLPLQNGFSLAYEKLEQKTVDPKSPTVIWVPGFMSGKDEVKPIHLRQFFFDNNIEYVRYDPTGIGESSGDLKTVNFPDWIKNVEDLIEKVVSSDEIILIGRIYHVFLMQG